MVSRLSEAQSEIATRRTGVQSNPKAIADSIRQQQLRVQSRIRGQSRRLEELDMELARYEHTMSQVMDTFVPSGMYSLAATAASAGSPRDREASLWFSNSQRSGVADSHASHSHVSLSELFADVRIGQVPTLAAAVPRARPVSQEQQQQQQQQQQHRQQQQSQQQRQQRQQQQAVGGISAAVQTPGAVVQTPGSVVVAAPSSSSGSSSVPASNLLATAVQPRSAAPASAPGTGTLRNPVVTGVRSVAQ